MNQLNKNSLINIEGTKAVFNNSFELELDPSDTLYNFEGKEVTLLEFYFDHYKGVGDGPDFSCYPQVKMSVELENGDTVTSSAWFDEVTPRPALFDIYCSALDPSVNFETLEEYEAEAAKKNPYPEGSEEHRVFFLGFTCNFYKQ